MAHAAQRSTKRRGYLRMRVSTVEWGRDAPVLADLLVESSLLHCSHRIFDTLTVGPHNYVRRPVLLVPQFAHLHRRLHLSSSPTSQTLPSHRLVHTLLLFSHSKPDALSVRSKSRHQSILLAPYTPQPRSCVDGNRAIPQGSP